MLSFIMGNIKYKLLSLLALTILMIMATVFSGFSALDKVINHYHSAINNDAVYLTQVSELNVNFKTQVQEWKNTLIRGNDPKQLNKYWGRFNKNVDVIQQQYKTLLAEIPVDNPAYYHLQQFAQSYPPMIEAYRKGYEGYMSSNRNISVADKLVKGIDREPTKNLTQAVKSVNDSMSQLSIELEAMTQNN